MNHRPSTGIPLWPFVGGISLLLLAIFSRWPYEFYFVLRAVVCVVAVYAGWQAYIRRQIEWTGVLAIVAVLYNPLVRIHLSRDIWQLVNLLTAGLLGIAAYVIRDKPTLVDEENISSNDNSDKSYEDSSCPQVSNVSKSKNVFLKSLALPAALVATCVSVLGVFWLLINLVSWVIRDRVAEEQLVGISMALISIGFFVLLFSYGFIATRIEGWKANKSATSTSQHHEASTWQSPGMGTQFTIIWGVIYLLILLYWIVKAFYDGPSIPMEEM